MAFWRTLRTVRRSAFERPPAVVRDAVALDLGCRTTRSHGFSYHRCEPGGHKSCQHVTREPMGEHKHFLSVAARTTGEELECPALLVRQAVSKARRHTELPAVRPP